MPLFVALMSHRQGAFDLSAKQSSHILDIVDLRAPQDFDHNHFCMSKSMPLPGLDSQTRDIFGTSDLVHQYWTGLRELFGSDLVTFSSLPVLVLCYDGDASRMACSMLRARGVEAYSVQGGFPALQAELQDISGSLAKFDTEHSITTEKPLRTEIPIIIDSI